MGSGPKRRIALIAPVLWALAIAVPAADGRRNTDPIATIACAGAATGTCTESGSITMPPNSTGSQSTDVVPTKSTTGTEDAIPLTPDEVVDFDSKWATIVDVFPKLAGIKNTFVRRVLTCAVMAPQASDQFATFESQISASASAKATDTAQLFLTICLQAVCATQKATQGHPARSASAGCGLAVESIPIEIERTGSKYSAQVNATPSKAGKTPLKVTCRAKRTGIQITMRPRARGRKLYQLIGPHMSIGFSNPTKKSVAIRTTFSFRK